MPRNSNQWSATRAGSGHWNGSVPPPMPKSGAPDGITRASSSRPSPLSANIPKPWWNWISNIAAWQVKAACRTIAAPAPWAPIRISSPVWPPLCAGRWKAKLSLAAKGVSVRPRIEPAVTETHDGRAAQRACQLHPLDHRLPHHRGDRLDVGHALSAAAVRLSHRNRARLGIQRALQGDGAAPAEGDHEPRHDRGVDPGAAAGLVDRRLSRYLAADQIRAGCDHERVARQLRPLVARLRQRPQHPLGPLLQNR